MAIRLRCECGQELVVPEGAAGNEVICSCGRRVALPASPSVAEGDERPVPETDRQAAEVLIELERLQHERPGWSGAIVMLVVSLMLYTAAAQANGGWDGILTLIPVLAFHELGHYVAMQ